MIARSTVGSSFQPYFDLVAIAASAGGLHALTIVLEGIPAFFPAAVVIVQHLHANRPTIIAQILGRRSRLPVKQVQDHDRILPGNVFTAPPDFHLLATADRHFLLSNAAPVNFLRPCANVFFDSAAPIYGRRMIGVVLSGTGSDGSEGIQAIKAQGGFTIAQDEASAEFSGMPRSAAHTGRIDLVLPIGLIPLTLTTLVMTGEAA